MDVAALSSGHRISPERSNVWNVPNALTTARLGLAGVLFACISLEAWRVSLVIFLVAAFTDWLDGYLARKHGLISAFGRNFDPLVDKILICGAFVFLLPVQGALLTPLIVTLVVARELVVTGLRGYFEARNTTFGADVFGKVKMFLQCAALVAIFIALGWPGAPVSVQQALIYAAAAATALSGMQYVVKAVMLFRGA